MRPHSLLELLALCIEADGASPGFEGSVSVIVCGVAGVSCLFATFGNHARVTLSNEASSADAMVFLGETEADAIVNRESLPTDGFAVRLGNEKLLARFIARYIVVQSPLMVRLER